MMIDSGTVLNICSGFALQMNYLKGIESLSHHFTYGKLRVMAWNTQFCPTMENL